MWGFACFRHLEVIGWMIFRMCLILHPRIGHKNQNSFWIPVFHIFFSFGLLTASSSLSRQRISESQRQFLLDGVQQNLRSDGRGPFDYRRATRLKSARLMAKIQWIYVINVQQHPCRWPLTKNRHLILGSTSGWYLHHFFTYPNTYTIW